MAGPVTKNTSSLALGLGQVRIGVSSTHIGKINPSLTESDSIGALTKSTFTAETEVWRHMTGFPQTEDHNIVISKKAMIEAEAEELSPYNVALAAGVDPSGYTLDHSGEIPLGSLTDIPHLRAELEYVFPDNDFLFIPVFPRAQVSSNVSLDFQAQDSIKNPMTIEAKRADSTVDGGHSVWDDAPLGRLWFKNNNIS